MEKFVRNNEVLFIIFYYYWGKENRSLYQGHRHIEVRYIEVPLYIITREFNLHVYGKRQTSDLS